jgi:hypothetical protein
VQVLSCSVHAELWRALLLLFHHALHPSGLAARVTAVFCSLTNPSIPPHAGFLAVRVVVSWCGPSWQLLASCHTGCCILRLMPGLHLISAYSAHTLMKQCCMHRWPYHRTSRSLSGSTSKAACCGQHRVVLECRLQSGVFELLVVPFRPDWRQLCSVL